MPAGCGKLSELFLQIHITSRCNLACSHCYMDGLAVDMPQTTFVKALQQFRELAEALSARRVWVQVTGGEPLVHPQVSELLEYSAGMFPTKLLTNGTLIDDNTAEFISKCCESVQISFDGPREIHDLWRGSGMFDAAFQGLVRLKVAGATTSARVTVGKENQGCIFQLLDQLGTYIDGFNVSRVVPAGQCCVHMPDVDAYRKSIYSLYGAHFTDRRIRLRDPFFGVLAKLDYVDSGFMGCSAGISGICVTETGDIYPCRRLPIRLGNLSDSSLTDVYYNHPLLEMLRERRLDGLCGSCEDRMKCGGSRCIAYAVSGDPLAEDPGCIFVPRQQEPGEDSSKS